MIRVYEIRRPAGLEARKIVDVTICSDEMYVSSLSFSRDGTTIATAGQGQLQSWDCATGRVKTQQSVQNNYQLFGWLAKGEQVIGGPGDSYTYCHDLFSGDVTKFDADHKRRLSPDGRILVSWNGKLTIRVLDPTSGEMSRNLELDESPSNNSGDSISLSPDGKHLLTRHEKNRTAHIRDFATGKVISTMRLDLAQGWVYRDDWSPDSKTVAFATHAGNSVQLFSRDTGQQLHTLRHNSTVSHVAFSPDGRTLASREDEGNIHLWEYKTGKRLRTIQAHTGGQLAWSADGRVIGASVDGYKFWHAETGELLGTLVVLDAAGKKVMCVVPNGHYRPGSSGVETAIVYVVQTASGQQALTPSEFNQKFGWQNEPDKVQFLPKHQ